MSCPTRPPLSNRNTIPIFCISLFAILELSGCSTYQNVTAYFNTYYNARKLFDDAVAEVRQLPSRDRDTNYFAPYNVPQNTQDKFDKVIEKCSKLIQFYAKTKYVDDAILMIGESYVYLGEYESATRKFKELADNFPGSDVRFEARLWDAKAKYSMKKDDEALAVIKDLFPDARAQGKNDILLEALMLQARIFTERAEYDQAASSYSLAAEVSGEDALRARAEYLVGGCYERLGNSAKAAEAYGKVRKFNPEPVLDFEARLRNGIMLTASGEHRRALKLFDDMNEDPLTVEQHALVDVEIGSTYLAMGDTAQAFSLFAMIDTTYKHTDASAKSYYRRGLVYEDREFDYKSARDCYNKSKAEYQGSDITPLAQRKAEALDHYFNALDDLRKYRDMYGQALHRDSLIATGDTASMGPGPTARADTLLSTKQTRRTVDSIAGRTLLPGAETRKRGYEPPDVVKEQLQPPRDEAPRGSSETLRRRLSDRDLFSDEDEDAPTPVNSQPTPGSLRAGGPQRSRKDSLSLPAGPVQPIPTAALPADSIKTLLAQTYFELGGIYYLELKRLDSALVWYKRVVRSFPSTRFVPRAIYAMAEIQSGQHNDRVVDSLYQILLTRYSVSEYAAQVRKIRGIEAAHVQTDPMETRYHEAENLLQSAKPKEALKIFKKIASSRKKSPFSPKATYAVGWLYETVLLNNDSAAEWYHHLTSEYPTSVYAAGVQPKIAVHDNPPSLKDYVKIKTIESLPTQPDSSGRPPGQRSRQTAADRIRQRQQEELNSRVGDENNDEEDNQTDEDDQSSDSDDNN